MTQKPQPSKPKYSQEEKEGLAAQFLQRQETQRAQANWNQLKFIFLQHGGVKFIDMVTWAFLLAAMAILAPAVVKAVMEVLKHG